MGRVEMNLSVLVGSVSRLSGGLFTSVRRLSEEVGRYSVYCSVESFEDEFTAQDVLFWENVEIRVQKGRGLKSFPISFRIIGDISASNPDVIHCHGIWSYLSIVNIILRKRRGLPYVVSPRGMLDPWALRNSALKKKLVAFLFEDRHLKKAACIHALCESEYKSIRAYGLMNPVAIIPNGIDVPIENKEGAMVNQHEGRRKKLLFLGRIHPKKGLKELIFGWSNLNEKSKNSKQWDLLIAGWDEGDYQKALMQQVSDLGLQDSVVFVGPKFGNEKDQLLRSVDAFILPSFSEGLPMSILEAWAYGLPVIMSQFCNIPEGFELGAAMEADPNPDSIYEALLLLFSMSDVSLLKMGDNGKQLATEKFAWAKQAGKMIEVYQWILHEGPPPDCVRLD